MSIYFIQKFVISAVYIYIVIMKLHCIYVGNLSYLNTVNMRFYKPKIKQ